MRFILNFIFYGILFYLIYLAFPEAFFTMVSWAAKLADLIKDLYLQLADRIQDWRGERSGRPPPQQAFFLLSAFLLYLRQKVL